MKKFYNYEDVATEFLKGSWGLEHESKTMEEFIKTLSVEQLQNVILFHISRSLKIIEHNNWTRHHEMMKVLNKIARNTTKRKPKVK